MLCLGSIGMECVTFDLFYVLAIQMDHVISEPLYKVSIVQRNYRKITITLHGKKWEPQYGCVISKPM